MVRAAAGVVHGPNIEVDQLYSSGLGNSHPTRPVWMGCQKKFPRRRVNVVAQLKADRIGLWLIDFVELIRLLDELSGWIRCFWVVGFLLNPVGRAFPVDVTGGGQGRAL